MEDFVPRCRHQIQPARCGEEAEEQVGPLHAAAGCKHGCLGDLFREDNVASLSFLNNTIVMLMKIYGIYTVLVPVHVY